MSGPCCESCLSLPEAAAFEAAEAVCPELDVLNSLTQLVNKSLVTVEEQVDDVRYRLLETVRQYARDKLLEMGEASQTRNSHFDYFFKLAIAAELKLEGSEALTWVLRLELEYDNIRAAMDWGLDNNVEAVLRMIPALVYFWNRRGLEEEGRHVINEALTRAEKLPRPEGDAGRQWVSIVGEAWQNLAMLAYSQGDNAHATEFSERAAALARQVDDKRLLALALGFEASGEMFLGHTEGVEALLEEGLAAARVSGDAFARALPMALYGQAIALTNGDYKVANQYIEEGFKLLQESGNRWGATMAILSMGMMEKFRGNYIEARQRFTACEPLFRDLGDKHRMNMVKSELAHIERYEGHFQKAEEMYRETLPEWKRIGHRAAIAHQLECFAAVAKVQEEETSVPQSCLVLQKRFAKPINIPMTMQERIEYDKEIADLRAGMDERSFTSGWAEGRAMSMDQAINFALEINTTKPV